MAAVIRIKIGASLDSSVDAVFDRIEKRAQRAARVVGRQLSGGKGGGRGGPYREQAKAAEDAFDSIEKSQRRSGQRMRKNQDRVIQEMSRGWKQLGQVAAREARRQHREQQRAGRRFAERTSHRATRFLTPNAPIASMARRAGSDILRGAGVSFDLSSSLTRGRELQKSAVALSNQDFFARQGKGGRVEAKVLEDEARTIGAKTGFEGAAVLGGLEDFTSKTGDLKLGRDILRDMARLSAASGTELEDMLGAAGDVSNALGDVPNKGKRIHDIMKAIAFQGAVGSVEIKDLATGMARLSSSAQQFEGDTGRNIVRLGALAQLSKETGGASTAREAATSIARMTSQFKTPARAKAFEKAGVSVFNQKGQVRDPITLIKEALSATGGDPIEMKKMFASTVGAKPMEALAAAYRDAGGGKKGQAAVDAKLEKFLAKAEGIDKIVDQNMAERSKTTAFKANEFQLKLDKVLDTMAQDLLPELEKLAPAALDAAKAFGEFATWISKNAGLAVAAAISASIARAGLESAFRAGVERAILGPNGGATSGGGRAAKVGSLASKAGAGLTIAATAITIASVGMMTIDAVSNMAAEGQRRKVATDLESFQAEQRAKRGIAGTEDRKLLENRKADLEARIAAAKEAKESGFMGRALLPLMSGLDVLQGKSGTARAQAFADAERISDTGKDKDGNALYDGLTTKLGRVEAAIQKMQSATLKVQVTNADEMKDKPNGTAPQ